MTKNTKNKPAKLTSKDKPAKLTSNKSFNAPKAADIAAQQQISSKGTASLSSTQKPTMKKNVNKPIAPCVANPHKLSFAKQNIGNTKQVKKAVNQQLQSKSTPVQSKATPFNLGMVNQSFSKQTLANQSGVVEQHKQKQDNKLVNALGVTNVKEVSFAGLSLEVKRRSIGQNSGLINDSISDMLTRIRNAVLAKKYTVTIPHTKLTQQIAQILEKEGFISGFYMEAPKTRSNVTAAYSNTTSEASKDKPANLTSSNITDLAFAGVITQPLVIRLKYRTKKTYNGKIKESCIINLKRISKPGLRVYANVREIQQKRILGGTGILIISTSAGLMTDIEARSRGIGGELLCAVW